MAKKQLTKKEQTIKIVKRMLARKTPASRAEILAELQSKVGMSEAQSATYYQHVKLGRWE